MHRFRTKLEANRVHSKYLGMHLRRLVHFRSRWIVVGYADGAYHGLGDHGWAYPLPPGDSPAIVRAYHDTASH